MLALLLPSFRLREGRCRVLGRSKSQQLRDGEIIRQQQGNFQEPFGKNTWEVTVATPPFKQVGEVALPLGCTTRTLAPLLGPIAITLIEL